MSSRALSLATVMLLIGCFSAMPAQAQNLEAGKSPSQIFAGTCTACHKSPRGLLKTVPASSLQGFLRQHYTTSPEMASLLSAFLISSGATDTRYVGNQSKGKDAKSEARPVDPPDQLDRFGRRLRPAPPHEGTRPDAEPQQAAKPDSDGLPPQADPGRRGRNDKRLARPGEAPDAAKPGAEGNLPAQAASERSPDGRKLSAKQKLGKRGKPGSEEPPKTEAAKTEAAKTDGGKDEPGKGEAAKDDTPKSETAKVDDGKPEASKPSGEDNSESTKIEPKETGSGETPVLRADPVPPVTPAPPASPAVSAAISSGTPEPAAGPSSPAAAQPEPPPAVTASAPPLPPVPPAGPPAPPISQ
ncbi:MAG TPA: hypothetical protein VIJ35_22145 [Bradyrhizobium sp.]